MSYFEVHQKLIYDMTCIDMLTIPGMDPIGIWDLLSLFLNIQYICICHILKITPSRNSFTIEDIQTWLCDTFWTTLWSAEVPYGAWGCHSAPQKNQPELITPCYTMIYHVPMAHSPTPSVPCINHRIPDSFASASSPKTCWFHGHSTGYDYASTRSSTGLGWKSVAFVLDKDTHLPSGWLT